MKLDRPNYWVAIVKAPQGGPIYTHNFESSSVNKILQNIIEGLDLSDADQIDIEFRRVDP